MPAAHERLGEVRKAVVGSVGHVTHVIVVPVQSVSGFTVNLRLFAAVVEMTMLTQLFVGLRNWDPPFGEMLEKPPVRHRNGLSDRPDVAPAPVLR